MDGTLLDLAERPDSVVTPSELLNSLEKVELKLDGALALISGRSIAELDCLFAPLRLRASGVHGAELRLDPAKPAVKAGGTEELSGELWNALNDGLRGFPGVFAENKRFSFAVHYRQAPQLEAPVREAVTRLVERETQALEVIDAHYAVEIKGPGANKGLAIASFLQSAPFAGRTPIFVGDDATDEAGFAFVSARGGFAYSVGPRRPGTNGAFAHPSDVRDWLKGFAEGKASL